MKTELAKDIRREKVMQLRIAGRSIREISAELNIPRSTVHYDEQEMLKELDASQRALIGQHRAFHNARIEERHKVLWHMWLKTIQGLQQTPQTATLGELMALEDRLLRLDESKRRMNGIDAATRASIEGQMVQRLAVAMAQMALNFIPPERQEQYASEVQDVVKRIMEKQGPLLEVEHRSEEDEEAGQGEKA